MYQYISSLSVTWTILHNYSIWGEGMELDLIINYHTNVYSLVISKLASSPREGDQCPFPDVRVITIYLIRSACLCHVCLTFSVWGHSPSWVCDVYKKSIWSYYKVYVFVEHTEFKSMMNILIRIITYISVIYISGKIVEIWWNLPGKCEISFACVAQILAPNDDVT